MKIDLVFIAYNRLEYTKMSLLSLLADPTEDFSLTIWDNASTDGTQDYLSSVDDPRIVRKVFARENIGLRGAVNDLFSKSSADLVGIVPDDLLVIPGWTRLIAQAHADVPEFGMVGCWHLGREYFDESRAKHKIQKFGRHQVLRHPWTGGGAGLVKLKTVKECGLLESNGTTNYWIRMALRGYVNGYYFPLIYVEHMDYPWSAHYGSPAKSGQGIKLGRTYNRLGILTLEEALERHQSIVQNILDDPWDVKYYVGWRAKLRRGVGKLARILKLS